MSNINYNYATSCENGYYNVKTIKSGYGLMPYGYDESKNIFVSSNYLLHKFHYHHFQGNYFEETITNNNYITTNEDIFINEDVIPFITNCSKVGTVHGFMDLYSIIIEYLDDFSKYSKYKILIYKDSLQGLLDIINHLCHLKVIDKNKLIFIEANKIYKFKSICFIENIYNPYDKSNFIKKCLTFKSNYIIDKISYLKPPEFNIDNILIAKTENKWKPGRKNCVNCDEKEVIAFCKKYNYTWLKPETMNEVVFCNLINNSKNFVISYGSSFLKNLPFINQNCQKVNVYSILNSKYDEQMKHFIKKIWKSKKKELNLKTDINFYSLKSFKDFNIK